MTNRDDHINPEQAITNTVNIDRRERHLSLLFGMVMFLINTRRKGRSLPLLLFGSKLIYRAITGYSPIYRSLGINTAIRTNKYAVSVPHQQGIHITESVTINRPIEDVYTVWRNFEQLPRFMKYLQKVKMIDNERSHWSAKGPGGMLIEWDAEMINDIKNEVIAWRSLEKSQFAHSGSIRFQTGQGNQETKVEVKLEYVPPLGNVGELLAKLLGASLGQQIADDLYYLKQQMESDEMVTIDG